MRIDKFRRGMEIAIKFSLFLFKKIIIGAEINE